MTDLCDSLTQLYQQKLIQQQQQNEQGKKAPKEKLYEEVNGQPLLSNPVFTEFDSL